MHARALSHTPCRSDVVERAAREGTTDDERRRLLSVAVVGGGPAGVEVAAEVHSLLSEDVARVRPQLQARVWGWGGV